MMNEMMKGATSALILGGKTARACDSCVRIRAKWFCAADDAFLCHGCDKFVHSANQLASKHQRVRLQTASTKSKSKVTTTQTQSWHSGFTRKARTPRTQKKHLLMQQQQQQPKNEEEEEEEEVLFSNTITTFPLVPELGRSEESLFDYESEEHLLCRVPVFDEEAFDLDNFPEFLPSDINLAADVENLLGNGHDEDSGHMKDSEVLLDCKEEDELIDANVGVNDKGQMVKVKDEDQLVAAAQEEEEKVPVAASGGGADKVGTKKERFFRLKLNYEEVITAWASQGSPPWTTDENPSKFNYDDCWPEPDYLGSSGADVECSCGEVRSLRGYPIGSADGGREARVSRYREKRRTRLFSKKIRYEVRKLNAEKRPRMKGRFVKRASFVGATAFPA